MLAAWAGAAAPVQSPDSVTVLTRGELLATGRPTLPEALQVLVPWFNFPRPSGADWTDHLRPATLRGMGSDQVLILVNGNRRHGSALVHQHPTVGRGELSPDLEAIPLAAVERVEISRGVPSAKYGSGAAAGTVNVVLGTALPFEATSTLGFVTSGGVSTRTAGAWRTGWRDGGTFQIAGEYRVRGSTNRAGPDRREQFFPGDPRNSDPAFANRVHDRLGDPQTRNTAIWVHGRKPLDGANLALTGSLVLNRRLGESAARWRRPSENATVRSLYPTGFLPLLESRSTDVAVRLAAQGTVRGWRWEAALGYGRNTLRMDVENTANASLGPLSPTELYAGRLAATELTGTAGVSRELAAGLPGPVHLAAGAEIRSEAFRLEPGERDSYRFGNVPIQDGPEAGGIAPVGAQGFPGFMPSDSGRTRRESVAGYAEAAITPVPGFRLAGSGRVEADLDRRYGTLAAGTASAGWTPIRALTVRGSLGTGYRIPPEAQRRYSRTLIPVSNDVGLFDLLVPADHPVAQIMGALPLRPERADQWSVGLDLSARGFTFSADYLRIAVRDRIVLTGEFAGPAVRFFLESQGHGGIGAVRFFTNAVDTETRGVELRAGYDAAVLGLGMRLDAGYGHHVVEVTRVDSIGGFARQFPSALFGPGERARIESGQPRDNALASLRVARNRWAAGLQARRYGSVLEYGPSPDGTLSQRLGARWLADVMVSYTVRPRVTVSAGLQNLLGTLPDRLPLGAPDYAGNSHFGILPYSSMSPFGFNGSLVYARAEWRYADR